jgi:hypothetical protein
VNSRSLNLRLDLRKHSPTGFEWGYDGSGPAQLALAILADHFGNAGQALALYQDFKRDVIAGLPHEQWTLTGADIDRALESMQPENAGGAS